mgnify:CR=1 FL=1
MHIEHLQENQKKLQQKVTDFYTQDGLHVYFKDQLLNDDVDFEKVISKVESVIPKHLRSEVEMIIVGHFKEFEDNHFNAFYEDGMIHVTNNQQDNYDMIEDIVHEIAHATEVPYGYQIYGDGKVKDEFLRKRYALHDILWKNGYKIPKSFFSNVEYDEEFDMLLLQQIGYDKLQNYAAGIFLTTYAPTSLREYYATAFAEFYLNPDGHNYIKKVSPQLYKKIFELYSEENLDV